jgi:hypothetical protein
MDLARAVRHTPPAKSNAKSPFSSQTCAKASRIDVKLEMSRAFGARR